MSKQILIGGNTDTQCGLLPRYANRHGLIAGATGTGKTVTLQCLAESFSDRGVPVFMADVKGDLSGISQAGTPHPKVDERNQRIGITDYQQRGFPVAFWDVFGELGTPVRTTVTEMGPALLTRLLDLNDTQEGVMNVVFEFADSEGLLLVDLADLRTTLEYLAEHGSDLGAGYGVAKASVNAILRRLLVLEREGGRAFFGEPSLVLSDFMQTTRDGRGVINLLAANTLIQSPRVYSTFLLWLLSELFETLPELGDPEQPVLVFFFDEAHLLFRDVPRALLEKIEQVVRLIRSKGVGVYFISQSPSDIPDAVLGQLGNRIQHALRAYTPREQKAVRVAAQSFRANPALDTVTAITELGVGEALVSTLEGKGQPSIVQRTLIRPPSSRLGAATPDVKSMVMKSSSLSAKYDTVQDRESAYEILQKRGAEAAEKAEEAQKAAEKAKPAKKKSNRQSTGEAAVKSLVRSVSSSIGRTIAKEVMRGIMGAMKR